jgi:hypothetical protein
MHEDIQSALSCDSLKTDTFITMKADASANSVVSVLKRTLRSEAKSRGVDITSTKAITEADGDIRQMCRKLTQEGETVVILSNDASLMVGVPSSVQMFCPRRCHLHRTADGEIFLRGPLISGKQALDALNRYIQNMQINNPA